MTSLPGSSLRTLPLNDTYGEGSSKSSKRRLLDHGQSLSSSYRDYGSSGYEERENSGSPLVSPIISDDEVVSYCSTESLSRRHARNAVGALQSGDSMPTADEEWFHVANPRRRKDHQTR